jgi:hypothetical protein
MYMHTYEYTYIWIQITCDNSSNENWNKIEWQNSKNKSIKILFFTSELSWIISPSYICGFLSVGTSSVDSVWITTDKPDENMLVS